MDRWVGGWMEGLTEEMDGWIEESREERKSPVPLLKMGEKCNQFKNLFILN